MSAFDLKSVFPREYSILQSTPDGAPGSQFLHSTCYLQCEMILRLRVANQADHSSYLAICIITDSCGAIATGTAEVGGWTTRELLSILDGLGGLRIIGADVVEVAPIYDNPGETTVLAAAEIAHSLLTLMVQTPVKE